MPSRDETEPSCMCPPRDRPASSACWAITPPRSATYSIARRSSPASATEAPSSVKIRTPASHISSRWAESQPIPPLRDGSGQATSQRPGERLTRLTMWAAIEGRLGVGHRHHRGVTARRGGRAIRWRCLPSTPVPVRGNGRGGRRSQGRPMLPAHRSPHRPQSPPSFLTRSPAMSRSVSITPSGVSTRPLRIAMSHRLRPPEASGREPPSDGHPVGDLVEDQRPGMVGDVGEISTPRFIGPGCITTASGDIRVEPTAIDSEAFDILVKRRKHGSAPRSSWTRSR